MSKRVIAGIRPVVEALRSKKSVAVVYVEAGTKLARELEAAAKDAKISLEERPRSELDRLAGEARHQGVVAIAGEYVYLELEEMVPMLDGDQVVIAALDEITDPHNFGAIVRSAVAFGAPGIVITRDRAAPVTPVVVRASAGATEHAHIARVTNLARTLATLKDEGFEIVGLAGEAERSIDSLPPSPRRVVVIGSEGRGLRRLVRERCDVLARIDMHGPIESLNASVAAGIALHALTRRD